MTRMTRPDCAVMCNLINTHTHTLAEPASRDQTLRGERGQGNTQFPYSADREQDWQPYRVDPYSCYPLHTNSGGGKERRILIGPW